MSKTIAWIEDNIDVLESIMRALERAGYSIVCLQSVQEALASIEQIRTADLILLDMLLPMGQTEREYGYFTGRDLLRELRKSFQISVPAIAFTVARNEELLADLRMLGVVDIVAKPVRPSELRARVEEVLKSQN